VQTVRFRVDGKTRYGALEGPAVAAYAETPWSDVRGGGLENAVVRP